MSNDLPYIVYGDITDSNGSLVVSVKVVLRNDRSGERINATTDANGSYALDAANLTNGYVNTDHLSVICASGDESATSSVLISDSPGSVEVSLILSATAESSDT